MNNVVVIYGHKLSRYYLLAPCGISKCLLNLSDATMRIKCCAKRNDQRWSSYSNLIMHLHEQLQLFTRFKAIKSINNLQTILQSVFILKTLPLSFRRPRSWVTKHFSQNFHRHLHHPRARRSHSHPPARSFCRIDKAFFEWKLKKIPPKHRDGKDFSCAENELAPWRQKWYGSRSFETKVQRNFKWEGFLCSFLPFGIFSSFLLI